MCNIAAYAGGKQAAPILIEMLRKQQDYDGGMSTGIATIHEGKLHWRKVVGDVDTLLRETDALSLPGTIGIAHTRPSGTQETYELAHPYVSMDERTALVSNGLTPQNQYGEQRDAALQMLEENGYRFRTEMKLENTTWPRLKNGNVVGSAEVRVQLVDYYIKQGMSCPEAVARTASEMYTDNVFVMLTEMVPDRLFTIRTSRPMNILLGEGESYLATTTLAFPEEVQGQQISLPLHHTCEIMRGSYIVTGCKLQGEKVCEMTPYTYAEGYDRICKLLTGKKDAPLYFDDLELAIARDMRNLWPEEHTYIQNARLVYEIIIRLMQEGKLRSEVRPQQCSSGVRNRVFMWLDEE